MKEVKIPKSWVKEALQRDFIRVGYADGCPAAYCGRFWFSIDDFTSINSINEIINLIYCSLEGLKSEDYNEYAYYYYHLKNRLRVRRR